MCGQVYIINCGATMFASLHALHVWICSYNMNPEKSRFSGSSGELSSNRYWTAWLHTEETTVSSEINAIFQICVLRMLRDLKGTIYAVQQLTKTSIWDGPISKSATEMTWRLVPRSRQGRPATIRTRLGSLNIQTPFSFELNVVTFPANVHEALRSSDNGLIRTVIEFIPFISGDVLKDYHSTAHNSHKPTPLENSVRLWLGLQYPYTRRDEINSYLPTSLRVYREMTTNCKKILTSAGTHISPSCSC